MEVWMDLLSCTAKGLGDDHTGADADARKQIDQSRIQQYAGPHRRGSTCSQIVADKEDVYSSIQLLDKAGPQQGQRKP